MLNELHPLLRLALLMIPTCAALFGCWRLYLRVLRISWEEDE